MSLLDIMADIDLLVIKYLEAGGDPEYIADQLKQISDIVTDSYKQELS